MVVLGRRSKAAVEAAGPMMVAPKVLEKLIWESATPTEDGLVREVWRVNEMPPAGSLLGRSKVSIVTRFLKPFMPSRTTFFMMEMPVAKPDQLPNSASRAALTYHQL